MGRPSVFDHPLVSERYFFPRVEAPAEVRKIAVDGAVLACAEHRPHADAPLLVHFHGNGEVVADYVPHVAEYFAAAGLNSLFVEYRGYGASTGQPALAAMLADVEPVLAAAGVPAEQIFVYGRSLGSIYAIEAARRCPGLAGLVIESGIADPLERVLLRVTPAELGVTREALAQEATALFDHAAKLASFPGRVLVIHGADDRTVPPSHAERNAAWARESQLVLLPSCAHNTILSRGLHTIVRRLQRFVSGG